MKFNSKDFKEITSILRVISNHASKKILEIYNSSFDIKKKFDNSPITEADLESNKIICDALKKKFPKIPIISEENKINFNNEKIFFLVDPLDGTKEFINRNGEFTVNIALIINSISHLGVIEIPVKNIQYFSDGENSFKVSRGANPATYNLILTAIDGNGGKRSFSLETTISNTTTSGGSLNWSN